jgi:uncharacterized protein YceK
MNIRFILWLALLGLCSGCGTIFTHIDDQGGVYSGVRTDGRLLATVDDEHHDIPVFSWVIPLSIFDMPLSLAADTLCLPIDLTLGASYGSTNSTPKR